MQPCVRPVLTLNQSLSVILIRTAHRTSSYRDFKEFSIVPVTPIIDSLCQRNLRLMRS